MKEIERDSEAAWRLAHSRLDAALVRGIVAPRLDAAFDRAVWARIESEQRSTVELPQRLARQLRLAARLSIVNWVAGGVVAIGCSIAFTVAAASSATLALLGTNVVSVALAIGGVAMIYGLATASPLRGLVRQYL
jgi:anti-sigma factor RsiW